MTTYKTLDEIPDTAPCTCETCEKMCERPCWLRPAEAKALIQAGYGRRLMADYWVNADGPDTWLLSCALKEYESRTAPFWPAGKLGCTFWLNGRCELHALGLKPLEGRVHDHETGPHIEADESTISVHEAIMHEWKVAWARVMFTIWRYGDNETEEE